MRAFWGLRAEPRRSALQGFRKPAPECFAIAAETLKVPLQSMVLIDDRPANIEAAKAAGLQGINFVSASQLRTDLEHLGLEL